MVVREKVEGEEVDIVVRKTLMEMQDASVGSEAGDRGVCVLNVEFNVSVGGRLEVVMELMTTRGGIKTGRDHTILMEAGVSVAQNGSEFATEITGNDSSRHGMASQRASGSGVKSVRRQLLCLLVRFDFAAESFG